MNRIGHINLRFLSIQKRLNRVFSNRLGPLFFGSTGTSLTYLKNERLLRFLMFMHVPFEILIVRPFDPIVSFLKCSVGSKDLHVRSIAKYTFN